MCDDGKQTDILERIFGKDMMTDELERDLTNRNELIAIVKGRLKSLAGKRGFLHGNSLFLNMGTEDFEIFDILKCVFLSSFNYSI